MLVNCHLYSVLQCSLFVAASTSAWTSSSFSSPSPSLLKESPAMEDTAVSANVLHHRSPSYPRAPMGLWLHPLLMANPMTYCPLLKGPKHMKHSLVSGNVFFFAKNQAAKKHHYIEIFPVLNWTNHYLLDFHTHYQTLPTFSRMFISPVFHIPSKSPVIDVFPMMSLKEKPYLYTTIPRIFAWFPHFAYEFPTFFPTKIAMFHGEILRKSQLSHGFAMVFP